MNEVQNTSSGMNTSRQANSQLALPNNMSFEDPLSWVDRLLTKLHTLWLGTTYPFGHFGRHVSVHQSCEISRTVAHRIFIENSVYLAPDVWLNLAGSETKPTPGILLGRGCKIGRRSMISARNNIRIEDDVTLSPSVLIMDHNHEYSDPNLPIYAQGVTEGGSVTIGRNCWIGYGAVIFCGKGSLSLGRNSVVGANSVVTTSFPDFSVVAGNPAKLVKKYDSASGRWVRVD